MMRSLMKPLLRSFIANDTLALGKLSANAVARFGPFTQGGYCFTDSTHQHQHHQVRHRSNRSRRGLYDGKDIRTGNNVSFSMKATKRTFKPNVFVKRVYSEVLDEMVKFHLTAATLRSIDKAGGLDNYLMKNEYTEGEGFVTKKRIQSRLKNRENFAARASEVA